MQVSSIGVQPVCFKHKGDKEALGYIDNVIWVIVMRGRYMFFFLEKMAQYKSRDPQNPYRTGCLVGNYVEDKFGREIAE